MNFSHCFQIYNQLLERVSHVLVHPVYYVKYLKISLALQRDSTSIITLTSSLKIGSENVIEVTRYLLEAYVSQRSTKYFNSQLCVIFIEYGMQREHLQHLYEQNFDFQFLQLLLFENSSIIALSIIEVHHFSPVLIILCSHNRSSSDK